LASEDDILHAGENIITVLTHILNSIFLEGDIPEVLKIGLLSPIFKNKGSKNDAINYRGITVLGGFRGGRMGRAPP
jgi:hypothetical protein